MIYPTFVRKFRSDVACLYLVPDPIVFIVIRTEYLSVSLDVLLVDQASFTGLPTGISGTGDPVNLQIIIGETGLLELSFLENTSI